MTYELTSTKPYLLRAMHEWMSANELTPLVLVDALMPDVVVPEDYVKDGNIVLNVAWSATRNLALENELISFEARFNGVSHAISFPLDAVLGIYARETGQGMQFDPAESAPTDAEVPPNEPEHNGDDDVPPPKGPMLRVVK